MPKKSLACFALMSLCLVTAAENAITLNSGNNVRIDGGKEVETARTMLSKLLPQAIALNADSEDVVTIRLGTKALAEECKLPPLENEEFMIAFPDAKTIVIAGGAPKGVTHGASEFLQRFFGVKWLFPGEAGLYLPKHAEVKIAMEPVRGKPYFIQRWFSWPYPHENHTDWNYSGWSQFNRLSYAVKFHHNLNRLFPWETYKETHREFYPKELTPNDICSWNPMLNAPGITEEAVKNICDFFRKNPNEASYSLGMNDCSRFEDAKPNGTNSVGSPNFSDHYFNWTNKVIAEVLKQYPDKYFGMLAYSSITDPPSFAINPHSVPFICIDRMRWYSEDSAEKDRRITEAWAQKAPHIGWYDYIYGDTFYLVPRIYNHLMADYLHYAVKHGVKSYYAESYNSTLPTEGPKTWLMSQLLWNPDADADALLDEWYNAAVGKDAAPHLRNYFDHWEKCWKERVPNTAWYKRYKDWTYFDFIDQSYMEVFTWRDISFCNKEMEAVVAKAKTPEEKRRAELFSQTWQTVQKHILYASAFHHPIKGGGEKRIFLDDFNAKGNAQGNTMPQGWIFWQRFPGKAEPAWVENAGRDGSGAITAKLENAKNTLLVFTKNYKTVPHRVYRFRCNIQAEDVGDSGNIFVKASWKDKDQKIVYKYALTKFCGPEVRDGKWHEVVIQFIQPPFIEEPTLSLQVGTQRISRGVLRMDNAELASVLPEKKN